jgi:competence protein ComEA
MIDTIKKYKWFIIGSSIIAVGILIMITRMEDGKAKESGWTIPEEELQKAKVEEEKIVEEVKVMLVDVKGAVVNPGVYEVMGDERVINVIEKAGGLKEGADETKVNFAQRVTDEMVLYIPLIGEEGANMTISTGTNPTATSKGEEKININMASAEELQNLPGIGPSKAEAIIAHRENSGLFQTIDDLKLVAGIGDKTFEKLQELIIVK